MCVWSCLVFRCFVLMFETQAHRLVKHDLELLGSQRLCRCAQTHTVFYNPSEVCKLFNHRDILVPDTLGYDDR